MIELLTIPVAFWVDQITKDLAEKKLSTTEKKIACKGQLGLKVLYNEGAFLGIFKSNQKLLKSVSILALVFLFFMLILAYVTRMNHLTKWGLSLVMGGAFGNLYDRVKRKKVVDFFTFERKPGVYFNLADFFVFIGALLAIIGEMINDLRS